MKRARTREDLWRETLTEGHVGLGLLRKTMRLLPGDPRCKICNNPFGGVGGKVCAALGFTPSRKNPRLCALCCEKMPLGGVETEIAILFADIRGSTALAETLGPTAYAEALNRFYQTTTEVMIRHDATIDKLIGDEVMAFFVPGFAGPQYKKAAVEAGRSLLRRLARDRTEGSPLPVGVGVEAGVAFVGNVGDENYLDFTALGDPVNMAQRIQAAARPGELLVGEAAFAAVSDRYAHCESRRLEVPGKSSPLCVHSVPVEVRSRNLQNAPSGALAMEKLMTQQGITRSPAENYQRFFVPYIGAPLADDLIGVAGLRPGERVLDVACGTGVVTRLAAERVGAGGAVAGLDLNAGMLAVARSHTPPDIAIDWYQANAESMPLPDEAFDVVLCQMGLQFIPDKVAALREMRRVLDADGRVIVTVPGPKPPMFAIMTDALARHLSPQAASFADLVFSLHDADDLTELMRSAGLREVDVQTESKTLRLPAPADFLWQYIHSTPLIEAVAQAGEAKRNEIERDVCVRWQEFTANGSMSLQVNMTTAVARK